MIFTVSEFRSLQTVVDDADMAVTDIHTISAAEATLRKVHEHTDWSTDPKYDVHKEPSNGGT